MKVNNIINEFLKIWLNVTMSHQSMTKSGIYSLKMINKDLNSSKYDEEYNMSNVAGDWVQAKNQVT